jgi:hypothetical protein
MQEPIVLLVGTKRGLQDLDAAETLVDGHAVTAVACGPTGWHALLDRRLVVRFDQAGSTPLGDLPEPDGQSIAILDDGTVLVGRTGARLASVGDAVRDVAGFLNVPGRAGWKNPAGPLPDTRSLASGPDRVWVNVHVGGVWWSDDAGATWHAAVEPAADVHEVRTGTDGRVAVAAAAGFGWSEDGGVSWSWTTTGLHGRYLRAASLDGANVFVSASDGPFTSRGAVYRARIGEGFTRCEDGLPEWFPGNVDTGRLDAADGRVAFGFDDRVYLSEDGGASWRAAGQLADPVTAVRLGTA